MTTQYPACTRMTFVPRLEDLGDGKPNRPRRTDQENLHHFPQERNCKRATCRQLYRTDHFLDVSQRRYASRMIRRRSSRSTAALLLSLAKTRSSFEMNDIRGGRVTSYMNDIQP